MPLLNFQAKDMSLLENMAWGFLNYRFSVILDLLVLFSEPRLISFRISFYWIFINLLEIKSIVKIEYCNCCSSHTAGTSISNL